MLCLLISVHDCRGISYVCVLSLKEAGNIQHRKHSHPGLRSPKDDDIYPDQHQNEDLRATAYKTPESCPRETESAVFSTAGKATFSCVLERPPLAGPGIRTESQDWRGHWGQLGTQEQKEPR